MSKSGIVSLRIIVLLRRPLAMMWVRRKMCWEVMLFGYSICRISYTTIQRNIIQMSHKSYVYLHLEYNVLSYNRIG